ncbi:endolytic transglycosylase MltG [bacterium]|nr:endolytic transglycosylase MltG [bacterium]
MTMVVMAAAAVWWFAYNYYHAPGPFTEDGSPRTVIIERGASVSAIADTLHAEGAIRDPRAFRAAARAIDAEARLKAGEYAVPSGASLRSILRLLMEGKSILYPFTVPEGLTSAMVIRRLKEEPMLTGDLPDTPLSEGVLLPDTYMFERGATRESVLKRMIAAQRDTLDELWASRQPGLPIVTPEEAVILASVVEKETGIAHERPQVASVFVNRLRRGMRLESDPTIIYGISNGEPLGRGLRRSELDNAQNLYNTYQHDGLPPTPIANPGRASLEAVLDPPVTDYIFFVADGTGGHAFAATYDEHLRNVQAWRRIEAEAAAAAGAGQ